MKFTGSGDFRRRRHDPPHFLESFSGSKPGLKNDPVRLLRESIFGFIEAAPAHILDVESVELGAIAGGIAEWGNVFGNHRARAQNRAAADFDELMNPHKSTDDDPICNHDMSAESGAVCDDVPVAKHNHGRCGNASSEGYGSDARYHASAGRSGNERNVFANGVVAADLERARLAFVFEVLWYRADGGEGEKDIAFADGGSAFDHHVRLNPGCFADPDT